MESNVDLCGECGTLGQSEPSTVWCANCDEALCEKCKTQHAASSFKESNSHQLIPIEIYRQLPSDVIKISQTCPEHNKLYVNYCSEHQSPCCLTCTLSNHEECKDMLPIGDVVVGVKDSNALAECEANLEESKINIAIIIKDRKQNISSLQTEKIKIKAKIGETRHNINEHLDKLEAQILQELTELEELHTSEIQALIILLEKKEQEIKKVQMSLSSIKEHASDLHIFLSMKKIEKLTSSDAEYLQSLCLNSELNNIYLSFEVDKSLKDIEKKLTTYGRVSSKFDPSGIVLEKRKEKQAQLHLPNMRIINSIKLDLIRSIDVAKNYLYGCCFLPDGRYAVTSNGKPDCINLMRENGTLEFNPINVKPHYIYDITYIPSNNTLAVTSGWDYKKFINLITKDTRRFIRSFPTNTKNYGVACKDGDIFYCAQDVGICKINVDTGKVSTIMNIPDMSAFSYIMTYQDKLYYTNKDSHTVTCCSIDGKTKWEYRDENVVQYPTGICVDTHGYVYVLGEKSNNLIVISPDGDRHSELLTKEDGLIDPQAVDYERNTNRVLVTNLHKKVFLYEVK